MDSSPLRLDSISGIKGIHIDVKQNNERNKKWMLNEHDQSVPNGSFPTMNIAIYNDLFVSRDW